MSINQHISLIDLNKQFPFEIDDQLKKEICFGETLIISCGHYEGDVEEDSSDSDWSCEETTENEESEEIKEETVAGEKLVVEETKATEVDVEEEDFHFYFFPDCTKPQPPQDSKASLIEVDGMPKLNPALANRYWCTCTIDKDGKCECHSKLPCYCGAKALRECTCSKLKTVCICDETKPPNTVCKCKGSDICVCRPGDKIRPVCTCDNVNKPCICQLDKFPLPICTCKEKPKFLLEDIISVNEMNIEGEFEGEGKGEEEIVNNGKNEIGVKKSTVKDHIPCECQKEEPKPRCMCVKGKVCICNENKCICDIQRTCVCEMTKSQELLCTIQEPVCEMDKESICSCPTATRECTCDPNELCKCFPKKICECGDPEKCKCFSICDCALPCICDTVPQKDECICLDKKKQSSDDPCIAPCSVHNKKNKKIKRVRAGKHGYRWCHDVDPHHTFFDYGYGRHDKVSYKEQMMEKIKISGLHVETIEGASVTQEVKLPVYKKKVRKASLDCCSAVGGISICVETLGEDKGKFLVQVVSHSSKEGAKTGSKLVSILDCNLHTLEENRSEYISKKDIVKERRSYMAICDNGYYNKVSRICGERHVVKRFYHSFEEAKNFLLEGANVVILRYLGLRRYRGSFKTETVLMDGSMCESIYVCQGVSQAVVNGKPLFVVKIERHIIEPSGRICQTLTVLTLRGYIVSHEWADNNYIIHVNPLLEVIPEKDHIEPHPPLREKWREDLQLLSDYLDFKSMRSSEGGRYVSECGALTETVRDYLQTLLMLRPQDALNFTRHYFGSVLSALDLPHDEYFDSCSRHVRYFFFEE